MIYYGENKDKFAKDQCLLNLEEDKWESNQISHTKFDMSTKHDILNCQ